MIYYMHAFSFFMDTVCFIMNIKRIEVLLPLIGGFYRNQFGKGTI